MPHASTLASHMLGKDNNLNLLRMVAATLVLVTHSFALTTGTGQSEPLRQDYGCTLGSIAVDIFFMLSGLLVTNSLLQRRSTVVFAKSRFFRIWPGLTVATLATVFILGPVFTTLSLSEYFGTRQTWRYLIKNLLQIVGIEFRLPGVFAENPWQYAVNGSIWTLQSEIVVYAMLLGLWILCGSGRRDAIFKALACAAFLVFFGKHLVELSHTSLEETSTHLYGFFFFGACLAIFNRAVYLRWPFVMVALALLLSTALFFKPIFPYTYSILMPYIIVFLGYVPGGFIRKYNSVGDYSYGTYIYAFPVQQMIAATVAGISTLGMIFSSFLATLAIAIASWTLVERHAIRWAAKKTSRGVNSHRMGGMGATLGS